MANLQYTVREIVDRAVSNDLGMPEFQRGFVWTPTKAKDLVESMVMDYPVGALLLWRQPRESGEVYGKTGDTAAPDVWIVDGQQRTTAMCLMYGRKPYWWKGDGKEWDKKSAAFNIHVSPLDEEPFFELPKRSVVNDPKFVSVREVLNADDTQIFEIAQRIHQSNPGSNVAAVFGSLQSVRSIGTRQLVAFEEDKSLEHTVESFVRLNQQGTKVSQGDIVNAQVAAQNPNWVNDTLERFRDELEESGFDLEPTLIYRSLIANATGKTRFHDVGREFWGDRSLSVEWPKVDQAWRTVINGLHQHGVLNSDILPSKNALVPLVVMAAQFKNEFRIAPALSWLIRATCTNRYSRTTDTRLAEDLRKIRSQENFGAAVRQASANLDELDFAVDDYGYFRGSYQDGAVRLMLYLLAYDNQAHDWSSSKERIGFSGAELLQKFNPDWHHIFPRAYLKGKVDHSDINIAANLVAIRKETNLKIGPKSPMEYMEEVGDKRLSEQYVPTDRSLFTAERYGDFIEMRVKSLAAAANKLMDKLQKA